LNLYGLEYRRIAAAMEFQNQAIILVVENFGYGYPSFPPFFYQGFEPSEAHPFFIGLRVAVKCAVVFVMK